MSTTIMFLLLCFTADAGQEENIVIDISKIAETLRTAVINEDTDCLLKYVSPSGTYFIDDVWSYEKVRKSMKDKDGWLFRHLFSNDNSVKNYFLKAKDLHIKVYQQNDKSVMISFQSSNYDPNDWVECCLIKVKGKWYFDGVFYCG